MPIFRKKMSRSAEGIFAIKADTQEEANKLFDEWFDDEDNDEEYNEFMSEHEIDLEEKMDVFQNEDSYNRCPGRAHDFWIEKKEKPNEPMYDLYLTYPGGKGQFPIKKVYENIKMDRVIFELQLANVEYILHPNAGATIEEHRQAAIRNATVISYRLERRT